MAGEMMKTVRRGRRVRKGQVNPDLDLQLGDGVSWARRVGCDFVVFEQPNEEGGKPIRLVIHKGDLERTLAWL